MTIHRTITLLAILAASCLSFFSQTSYADHQVWVQGWPVSSVVTIRSRHSNKCLDVPNNRGHYFDPVQQWNCHGQPSQQFRLLPDLKLFHDSSGRCVGVDEASPNKRLVLISCGAKATVGVGRHRDGSGWWFQYNQFSPAKCIDIPWGNTNAGVRLIAYRCTGNSNQKWYPHHIIR